MGGPKTRSELVQGSRTHSKLMKGAEGKLIMITGCNKGIGYGILKNLASLPYGHRFIMAIRTLANGEQAIKKLAQDIPDISTRVIMHQLDLASSESINQFVEWLKVQPFKLDCLVNNAAIASSDVTAEIIKTLFQTNLYATIELTEKILPIMADSGKVLFISSGLGSFKFLGNKEVQQRLESPTLTKEVIYTTAKEYYDMAASNPAGIPSLPFAKSPFYPAYSYSKLLLNLYTRILGADPTVLARKIQIYACHPGWVRTDLGGPSAPMTIEQGAICPCYVVNLPYVLDPNYQGKFFSESAVTPF